MAERMIGAMTRPPKFRRTYIRAWRKYRDLTQEQLAEKTGLTAVMISHLERRTRGYSQETLEAIAEALQTDVGGLLSRDPETDEPIWSLWQQANPTVRSQIVDITKTLTKPKS